MVGAEKSEAKDSATMNFLSSQGELKVPAQSRLSSIHPDLTVVDSGLPFLAAGSSHCPDGYGRISGEGVYMLLDEGCREKGGRGTL